MNFTSFQQLVSLWDNDMIQGGEGMVMHGAARAIRASLMIDWYAWL